MSLRDDLAALDATPAEGWTADQRAEHSIWVATLDPADIAADPDAVSIYSYFLGKTAETDAALERTRRWLAAEDEAIGDDEIPF